MTEEDNNSLRIARKYQMIFLASVFVYAAILVYLRYRHFSPVDGLLLDRYTLIFTILGSINFAYGYLAPLIMAKYFKPPLGQKRQMERAVSITRAGSFEALAIYGFVLGILGASWEVVLIFFAVAVIAMVHTFPSKAK